MKERGVRRSARLGDGWPITPETRIPDMVRLLARTRTSGRRSGGRRYGTRFAARSSRPPRPRQAYARFEWMAKDRLLAYAQRQLATRDAERDRRASSGPSPQKETFLGTPASASSRSPSSRPSSPSTRSSSAPSGRDMSGDEVVAYLDDLGRDIVPAVREITSVPRVVRPAR